ncbi:MAG: FtsW/RodA/SpoVE family cell cycle protein [Pseudanabaenaceae cyanobacterium]
MQLLPFLDQSVQRWAIEARVLRWLIFLWLFVGLAVLFSASYPVALLERGDGLHYFKQQLLWSGIGLVCFQVAAVIPLRLSIKFSAGLLIVTLCLLLATYFVGETRNEATRWLGVGSFLVQPSELLKPFLLLRAAQLFGRWYELSWRTRWIWLGIFLVCLLGILLQPSLSVTAQCGITLWLMAWVGGVPLWQMLGSAVVGCGAGLLSLSVREYQRRRVLSFINPWADQAGDGYQLTQSLMAIGSGQVWGTGFGLSQQKLFLPVQYTDFIMAIFAEEFGLVGCCLLVLMLLVFAGVGFWVGWRSENLVVRLVAIGGTIMLVGQAFLNIGVAVGVLPTTGLPFPFFSYGGSSMLASFMTAGFLVRSARETATAQVIPLRFPTKK